MAYVPVPFPTVVYDSTGLGVTVATKDALAQLPATFAPTPTVSSALMAFPPSLVAQVIMPLPVDVSVAIRAGVAANVPKKSRSHDARDN